MKVLIVVFMGIIMWSFAGVAAAGSRCDTGTRSPSKIQPLLDVAKKGHDAAMAAIQNIR